MSGPKTSRPPNPGARLPRGPHPLSREQVAADQRRRLMRAAVAVIGEQGYATTTVYDVITRAGVSRKTFYENFRDMKGCVLQVYDEIAVEGTRRMRNACGQAGDWAACVETVIGVLARAAVESPHALRLMTVEIAALGPDGILHRDRVMALQARFLREGLERTPGESETPEQLLRAIIGGTNRILHARLYGARRGKPPGRRAALPGLVPDLVRWARGYHSAPAALGPAGPAVAPAAPRSYADLAGGRAPGTLSLAPRERDRRGLLRGERTVSSSFVVHSQRERILDAIAKITAAKGYGSLTIKNIALDAAVSPKTFYEHFTDKEDAFLVTYEVGYTKALAIYQRTYDSQPDWARGMRTALSALLHFLASEPAFAHLALVDTLIATPRATTSSSRSVAHFAKLLEPGFEAAPEGHRPPAIVVEAIPASIFELMFDYVARGRTRELPELAPQATFLALAPFLGASEAGRVAVEGAHEDGRASVAPSPAERR
jgi:AcrR family transcriptional regulator